METDPIKVILVRLIEKPEKSLGPEWEKEGTEILHEAGVVKQAGATDDRDPRRA